MATQVGGHYRRKEKSITKDEIIIELMERIKVNGRPIQAADVFGSVAYEDMPESKCC